MIIYISIVVSCEKYILDYDGFLLRAISMIVSSSVDNGRTFYDHERKWANFHRGDTVRTWSFYTAFLFALSEKVGTAVLIYEPFCIVSGSINRVEQKCGNSYLPDELQLKSWLFYSL